MGDSDRKILVDACDKAQKWLNTVSESLQKTPKHVTPTTTVKMIQAAVSELHTSCLPVITKPKPKPKEPERRRKQRRKKVRRVRRKRVIRWILKKLLMRMVIRWIPQQRTMAKKMRSPLSPWIRPSKKKKVFLKKKKKKKKKK